MPMKDIPGPMESKQIHKRRSIIKLCYVRKGAEEIWAKFWTVEWISPTHNRDRKSVV